MFAIYFEDISLKLVGRLSFSPVPNLFLVLIINCFFAEQGGESIEISCPDDDLIQEANDTSDQAAGTSTAACGVDDDGEASTSSQSQPSRRLVERRTRRVRSKLTGRNRPRATEREEEPLPASQQSEVGENQALGDQPPTRRLKYVVENLRACQTVKEKATFMLDYFGNCSFNAGLCPDSIIRFSDDEALQLSRYVQVVDDETDDVVEPEVCTS